MMTRSHSVRAVVVVTLVLLVFFHVEMIIAATYAPEAVLLQVYETEGRLEGDVDCFGDITSLSVNVKKKPLRALGSIYEHLDPASFFASQDQGFHLLETGFSNYEGPFEIRIVCYSKDFRGVSYTIINNENQHECGVDGGGRIVVC